MIRVFNYDIENDDADVEGAEFDCPYCGSDAIQNDSGSTCSNPSCPSNQ